MTAQKISEAYLMPPAQMSHSHPIARDPAGKEK
jgi:hypothetical protein